MTKIAATVLLLGALACAPQKPLTQPAVPTMARCGTDTECMELCIREGGTDCHLPYAEATK